MHKPSFSPNLSSPASNFFPETIWHLALIPASVSPHQALPPDSQFPISGRWKGENVATTEVAEALEALDFLQEVNVYGVTVPGAQAAGRAPGPPRGGGVPSGAGSRGPRGGQRPRLILPSTPTRP